MIYKYIIKYSIKETFFKNNLKFFSSNSKRTYFAIILIEYDYNDLLIIFPNKIYTYIYATISRVSKL